jgi:hypothetical protein
MRKWRYQVGVVRRRWASFATAAVMALLYAPLSLSHIEVTRQLFYAETAIGLALWVVWGVSAGILAAKKKRMAAVDRPALDDDMTLMSVSFAMLPFSLVSMISGLILMLLHGVSLTAAGIVGLGIWLMLAASLVSVMGLITSGLRLSRAALKPLIIGA